MASYLIVGQGFSFFFMKIFRIFSKVSQTVKVLMKDMKKLYESYHIPRKYFL